jgi:hypothetical protein
MKLPVAAVALLAIAVVAFACVVVAWLGLDREMAIGVGVGLLAGIGLTLLGGRGLSRALGHSKKSALILHMYGGFLLRLVLLVVGFSALYVSGAGNPVGFAVAFLAGTVTALFMQVVTLTVDRSGVVALSPNA